MTKAEVWAIARMFMSRKPDFDWLMESRERACYWDAVWWELNDA